MALAPDRERELGAFGDGEADRRREGFEARQDRRARPLALGGFRFRARHAPLPPPPFEGPRPESQPSVPWRLQATYTKVFGSVRPLTEGRRGDERRAR